MIASMILSRTIERLNRAEKLLREAYEFYMGPHACGNYTCNCNATKQCGVCDLRAKVESYFMDVDIHKHQKQRPRQVKDHFSEHFGTNSTLRINQAIDDIEHGR